MTKRQGERRTGGRRRSINSQIAAIVLAGIAVTAVTVSVVVLFMSKRAFARTYGESQAKVFSRIEDELNECHEVLMDVANAIDGSWAFRLYLTGGAEVDNVRNFQNIYQMERDLSEAVSSDMERLNILVLGLSGEHYLSRTETICVDQSEIWGSEAARAAILEPDNIHYTFSHGAFTATAKDSDVVIATKALSYQETGEIYGLVIVTLDVDTLSQYYDYFVSDYTSFYMVGPEDVVYASDDRTAVGTMLESDWYREAKASQAESLPVQDNGSKTVLRRDMSFWGCTIYGVIDNDLAQKNLYNMPLLMLLCALIAVASLTASLLITRRITKPLGELSRKMALVREGDFTGTMPVEGPYEVSELVETYNYMLGDIETYIHKLLAAQEEIRRQEIKALQMQINPHYIYNTLASIKWLIYQNDPDRSAATIDAFISLLRNTISNKDEFITVEQELENLQNYVCINNTRYGDNIRVEYFVSQDAGNCLLPKLVVQPFIENAFFHAFPSGRAGLIQILMGIENGVLTIRVVDDGIGIEEERIRSLDRGAGSGEHFSGIGIHNIQERLRLLYGPAYGVSFDSRVGEGTTVTITLPVRRKEEV